MLVYDLAMGVILGTDFSYCLDLTGSLWIAGCLETGAVWIGFYSFFGETDGPTIGLAGLKMTGFDGSVDYLALGDTFLAGG